MLEKWRVLASNNYERAIGVRSERQVVRDLEVVREEFFDRLPLCLGRHLEFDRDHGARLRPPKYEIWVQSVRRVCRDAPPIRHDRDPIELPEDAQGGLHGLSPEQVVDREARDEAIVELVGDTPQIVHTVDQIEEALVFDLLDEPRLQHPLAARPVVCFPLGHAFRA